MHIHLILKRKWFDMIKSGEKTEEYREIKDYWIARLVDRSHSDHRDYDSYDEMLTDMRNPPNRHRSIEELMKYFEVKFKPYSIIHFQNGYSPDAPKLDIKCLGLTIAKGREEWGAEPGKYYFVFKLAH